MKFELRYARGEFIEQVHHQSVLFNVHRDYERHCKFWRPGVAIAWPELQQTVWLHLAHPVQFSAGIDVPQTVFIINNDTLLL